MKRTTICLLIVFALLPIKVIAQEPVAYVPPGAKVIAEALQEISDEDHEKLVNYTKKLLRKKAALQKQLDEINGTLDRIRSGQFPVDEIPKEGCINCVTIGR